MAPKEGPLVASMPFGKMDRRSVTDGMSNREDKTKKWRNWKIKNKNFTSWKKRTGTPGKCENPESMRKPPEMESENEELNGRMERMGL